MGASVRAFLAVELSEDVRAALAVLVKRLSGARISGLRTVDPSGVHLTIRFLGDIGETQVEAITGGVSVAARRQRPFTVELDEVGAFPNSRSPRVLWVGIGGDLGPLHELHASVEKTLAGIGFPPDKRDFDPHLTVARLNHRTSPDDRRRAAEALFSAQSMSGTRIQVASLSLVRSILSPAGARYARLALFPLASPTPRP